jgi:nitroimidazol reductase NimA-like FMN-containing flavoprotein (pyridoxamine 5'-phosphate oxidase superfamily)
MHNDRNGMLVLDESACHTLLHSTRLGRIALTDRALPMILPITFACVDRDIVFRVGPGTLRRAADAEQVVCFETDWADECGHAAWSVAAIGRLTRVDEPGLVEACRQAGLPLWSNMPTAESGGYIALSPQLITGRRRAG